MRTPGSYFFSDFNFKKQSSYFKIALYLFVITKCVYWLSNYSLLIGENSIVYSRPYNIGTFKNFAFLLHIYNTELACLCFIVSVILLCIVVNTPVTIPFLYDLALWFLVLNLHNKFYPTLTGGDFLLNQFLFFNVFLSGKHEVKKGVFNEIRICLHNFGSIAIIIQICIVYFVSGITKLRDDGWMSGEAVSMISRVDHYSTYSAFRFSKDSALATLLTYIVMFYQLLFPVLIWFSKIKKPLIIIGMLIHLYISFVMGLFSFGIIMLLAYIYFWPFKNKMA